MHFDHYPRILAEHDEYKTIPDRRKFTFINPSVEFFKHLLWILIYCNRMARKGIYDKYNWVASSLDVLNRLEEVGIKFHVTGMINLSKFEGPAVFISNHMSTLETMVLPGIIQPIKHVLFVIKQELANYPLFGPIARSADPILVGRENPREDLKIVLEQGSEKLSNGKSIIIFPQRTRSIYFDEKSFNTLGVKLAKRNNVHVVPIALFTNAWDNGKLIKDVGKIDPNKEVKISFGEPMRIQGNGSDEHEKIVDYIKSKLISWDKGDLVINSHE
ncbi:MAG: glycerol acyltransferase [Ignavibacteria bacterium RBG_13_36_8]|nr:MAG: glycerol acyltransferase [Ignavibacteria bacterium RBG_13_36_8]